MFDLVIRKAHTVTGKIMDIGIEDGKIKKLLRSFVKKEEEKKS